MLSMIVMLFRQSVMPPHERMRPVDLRKRAESDRAAFLITGG